MPLPSLVVKILGDISDFENKMGTLDGNLSGASSKLQATGAAMTATGMQMTAGITAPIVGAGVAAVKMASDLNESMNKVDVVFGANAAQIQTWAQGAAKGFGQSRQQALEAAGTFGNLFSSMGMGVEKSAAMSTSLVELAGDLASFNNIDPTVALEKLRAGLVGEVEPLRTLGVNLSAAAVEAKAMEMGLASSGKELDASSKAQAAYALILEQTKNAQGDFARTSDGLANSSRILKAELADAAANLGTQLLPISLKVVQGLTSMVERFTALSPETQKWILIIAGAAAAIGPVLIVIGSLISAVGTIIGAFTAMGPVVTAAGGVIAALGGPVTLIIAAVAALAAAWATNFMGIRDITYSAIGAARDFIGNAVSAIRGFFSGSWSEIGQRMMQGIADGIRGAWSWVVDAASGAANAALNAAKSALGIASPSKRAADEIGQPFAQGVKIGAEREIGRLDLTASFDRFMGNLQPAAAVGRGSNNISMQFDFHFNGPADAGNVERGVRSGVLDALRQVGLA